ncbi:MULTISPECIES: dihydroxyacetone kinase subunit DhaL [Corynebacterium]|uniref:dihydroxyacetone kinase subunit DhaL n=1 Tax=Corynebacterium TaxID=1716 RepID=UPI00124EF8CF|nr:MULTISPECIES: dihydroxyacetone kinase subunit DhaL [Corynebacterium]
MAELSLDWALAWIDRCVAEAAAHRVELTDLDRAIGDADHGENLDRGFGAVSATLKQSTPDTPAAVFKTVAATLISTVGGASGPLLGTAFMRLAKVAPEQIDATAVAEMYEAAVAGIQARGKAEEGEKTMVDAWAPAAAAARAAATEGADAAAALQAAADAAAAGAEATIPMKATKGRASYLGERSEGHKDPGATSSSYFLAAAAAATQEGK